MTELYNRTNSLTVYDAGMQLDENVSDSDLYIILGFNQDEPSKIYPFTEVNSDGGVCDCCSVDDLSVHDMIVHSILKVPDMKVIYKLKPEGIEEETLYGTGDKSVLFPKGILNQGEA